MGQITTSAGSTGPVQAFIYDRHVAEGDTVLVLHLEVCRLRAREIGWPVAGEWVDRGSDALFDGARPQFDAMLEAMQTAAAAGRTVVCLVTEWARLSDDEDAEGVLRARIKTAGGYTSTVAGESDRPGFLHRRSTRGAAWL